jgi:L-ascorbate metabolism protein UlaG (beta-lactamase superfamily)
MKIEFLGHSCFLITSSTGKTIITDPYHTGEEFNLSEIAESADIVTISHDHPDHNNSSAIQGDPQIVTENTDKKGVSFKVIESYHDAAGGKERGNNRIFVFVVDDIRICHLGDLGHRLDKHQLVSIGSVDVLFVPVGGGFTINSTEAEKICVDIGAKVIIPMHYRSAGLSLLGDVGDFLSDKDNVTTSNNSELELTLSSIPMKPEIVVLEPRLLTS